VALAIDLHHWATFGAGGTGSEAWRFARTVLCFVPALWLWRGADRDGRSVAVALGLAVVADMFLILHHDLLRGIALFGVMQLVLLHRHLRAGSFSVYFRMPLLRAVLMGAGVVVLVNALLWNALSAKGLALPVLVYGALLIGSTVTAYGAGRNGVLPADASRLAFWGMVLFVLCDITVGVGAAFGHTQEGELVRSLTGLFYTPSLLLLVRSGMR
jgi:hypothetical protein